MSLAFVRGLHRWPVNCPHKGPVTRTNVSIGWRHHDGKKDIDWNLYISITEVCNYSSTLLLHWRFRYRALMSNYILYEYNMIWYAMETYSIKTSLYRLRHFLRLFVSHYLLHDGQHIDPYGEIITIIVILIIIAFSKTVLCQNIDVYMKQQLYVCMPRWYLISYHIMSFLFLAELYVRHSKLPRGIRNMYLSMNNGKYPRICFLFLFADILSTGLSSIAGGVIKKDRLCVQYEINDYNSSAHRCDALNAASKTACFMECAYHRWCLCRAFQFNSWDGFCEILGKEKCMAENKTPNILFVSVSECKSILPWHSTKPVDGKWRWVTDPPTRKGTVKIKSPGGGVRHVVRAFHQGLFLAGSFTGGRLFAGIPSGGILQCTSNVQFMIFENSSDYSWENFYKGDPIPSTAIVSGYGTDGAPLYIVRTTQRPYGTLRAQIYSAKSLQIYPSIPNRVPEMKILIAV